MDLGFGKRRKERDGISSIYRITFEHVETQPTIASFGVSS